MPRLRLGLAPLGQCPAPSARRRTAAPAAPGLMPRLRLGLAPLGGLADRRGVRGAEAPAGAPRFADWASSAGRSAVSFGAGRRPAATELERKVPLSARPPS